MHDTTMEIGKLFLILNLVNKTGLNIVDVGAQDVNGSLLYKLYYNGLTNESLDTF